MFIRLEGSDQHTRMSPNHRVVRMRRATTQKQRRHKHTQPQVHVRARTYVHIHTHTPPRQRALLKVVVSRPSPAPPPLPHSLPPSFRIWYATHTPRDRLLPFHHRRPYSDHHHPHHITIVAPRFVMHTCSTQNNQTKHTKPHSASHQHAKARTHAIAHAHKTFTNAYIHKCKL